MLRETLKLQGDLLCESHTESHNGDRERRMFEALLELMKLDRLSDERKQSFGDALFKASLFGTSVDIRFSGNIVTIHGDFDLREVAKRMVWGEIAEDMRVVEEVRDD